MQGGGTRAMRDPARCGPRSIHLIDDELKTTPWPADLIPGGIVRKTQFCPIEPKSGEAQTMVRWSRQKDGRIQKVVQVLSEDPSRTLPELAQTFQLSMSRLSHLFKDEIGVNVKHYRIDCRLQITAAMLVFTSTPIKEIAYMAGYRHSSSFARAFKTHFGLSPASYRTKLRRAA
jgi:transcriptional regulator GlxA family with amidase domain